LDKNTKEKQILQNEKVTANLFVKRRIIGIVEIVIFSVKIKYYTYYSI